MDMVFVLKIVADIFVALIMLLIMVKTIKGSSLINGLIIVLFEAILTIALIWGMSWMIDQSFKKAALTKFSNRFIFRAEKLALTGCVKNIGKYKINHVYLHIKIINNAVGGGSTNNNGRDNTLKYSTTVAKNLAKGSQKCFSTVFKYPAYFKLANIQKHLSWD